MYCKGESPDLPDTPWRVLYTHLGTRTCDIPFSIAHLCYLGYPTFSRVMWDLICSVTVMVQSQR